MRSVPRRLARLVLASAALLTAVSASACRLHPPSTDADGGPLVGFLPQPAAPSLGPLVPPTPVAPARPTLASPRPTRPKRFSDAKRALVAIYEKAGRTTTLYCGCPYVKQVVDIASCGYTIQSDAQRARRVEWEHVVPASAFGHAFEEWTVGAPACVKSGKPYHGRKCAERASDEFQRIEGDMHNLFPEDGELNALRGDRVMGELPGEPRRYGACDVEISEDTFEPRPEVRGEIARAYQYMDATYPGLGLVPDALRPTLRAWDAGDPPDAWERARNDAIFAAQGNRNPFVDAHVSPHVPPHVSP